MKSLTIDSPKSPAKGNRLNYEPLFINCALLGFAAAAVFYLLAFQNAPQALPQTAPPTGGADPRTKIAALPNRTKQKYAVDSHEATRQDWQQGIGRLAFGLFIAATCALTLAFVAVGFREQWPSMSVVAGLLLTLVISWLSVLGHLRFKIKLIGAFVAPLATLILLVQSFVTPTTSVGVANAALSATTNISLLIGFHVVMAVLGQAFAIIACAVSIFYLWQQSLLKKKLITQLPRSLPAIDKLDALLTACLWGGFVFITLSLLSGAIYAQFATTGSAGNSLRGTFGLEFKVIWAITIWLWYLATLLARNIFNRSGKRIAQMSLGGFLLLAMTYFGIGFFKI